MSWNDPDVYYQPEKFGLSIVREIDDPEASYSFDMIVVWKHDDGRIFWADDSGCSCPSPFESHTNLESLNLLTDDSWKDFESTVSRWLKVDWRDDTHEPQKQALRTEILQAAAHALRQQGGNK